MDYLHGINKCVLSSFCVVVWSQREKREGRRPDSVNDGRESCTFLGVEALDDGTGEIGSGSGATHIGGPDLAGVDDIESRARDIVRVLVEAIGGVRSANVLKRDIIKTACPKCLSIIVALRIMAAGFARLVPMRSFATCRHPGSKSAYS